MLKKLSIFPLQILSWLLKLCVGQVKTNIFQSSSDPVGIILCSMGHGFSVTRISTDNIHSTPTQLGSLSKLRTSSKPQQQHEHKNLGNFPHPSLISCAFFACSRCDEKSRIEWKNPFTQQPTKPGSPSISIIIIIEIVYVY